MPKRELTAAELALREHLGKQIRALSAARGLKPTDLAKATGVALSQQYRIEAGELTPDILYIVKIANCLGLSVDALLATATPGAEETHVNLRNVGVGAVQVVGSRNRVTSRAR